jgi:hypothetical protein
MRVQIADPRPGICSCTTGLQRMCSCRVTQGSAVCKTVASVVTCKNDCPCALQGNDAFARSWVTRCWCRVGGLPLHRWEACRHRCSCWWLQGCVWPLPNVLPCKARPPSMQSGPPSRKGPGHVTCGPIQTCITTIACVDALRKLRWCSRRQQRGPHALLHVRRCCTQQAGGPSHSQPALHAASWQLQAYHGPAAAAAATSSCCALFLMHAYVAPATTHQPAPSLRLTNAPLSLPNPSPTAAAAAAPCPAAGCCSTPYS